MRFRCKHTRVCVDLNVSCLQPQLCRAERVTPTEITLLTQQMHHVLVQALRPGKGCFRGNEIRKRERSDTVPAKAPRLCSLLGLRSPGQGHQGGVHPESPVYPREVVHRGLPAEALAGSQCKPCLGLQNTPRAEPGLCNLLSAVSPGLSDSYFKARFGVC